jgi:O-antigen ligase
MNMTAVQTFIDKLAGSNGYGWVFPALVVLLLPFQALIYIPLVIMALAGLFTVIYRNLYRNVWHNRKFRLLIIVFSLIWLPMLVSLPDAVNMTRSASTTFSILPYLLVGFFIISTLDSDHQRERLNTAILFITSFWCLDALVQLFLGVDLFGNPYIVRTRLTGIFYPDMTLGLMLALFAPVVFAKLREMAAEKIGGTGAIFIAACYITIVILAGSRTALIMLIIVILCWFSYVSILNRHVSWRGIALSVAITIPVIATLTILQPTNYGTLMKWPGTDLKALDRLTDHRLPLWDAAAHMSLEHWFNGVGPRGFRYAYDQYRPEAGKYDHEFIHGSTHPHFALLEIAAETGLIGLCGIMILFYILFRILYEGSPNENLNVFPWFLGAVIAVVPNVAKALYSTSWMTIVLCMIFVGISNTNPTNKKT